MIRVAIVDDHTLVRAGLCRILEAEPDIEVVGQAGDGRAALSLCEQQSPDVLLLDFSLPDLDGLEVVDRISKDRGSPRVLVLTMHSNEEYAIRLIRAGASGYLVKGASADELLRALRTVAAGGRHVSAMIQEKIVSRLGFPLEETPEAVLSNREMQVLIRLAQGATSREVAHELCISLSTVETHRGHVLSKLNLRNNADLTRFAIRRDLVGVDD